MYVYIHVLVWLHKCLYLCMFVRMYDAYIHVCMHVCVFECIWWSSCVARALRYFFPLGCVLLKCVAVCCSQSVCALFCSVLQCVREQIKISFFGVCGKHREEQT